MSSWFIMFILYGAYMLTLHPASYTLIAAKSFPFIFLLIYFSILSFSFLDTLFSCLLISFFSFLMKYFKIEYVDAGGQYFAFGDCDGSNCPVETWTLVPVETEQPTAPATPPSTSAAAPTR